MKISAQEGADFEHQVLYNIINKDYMTMITQSQLIDAVAGTVAHEIRLLLDQMASEEEILTVVDRIETTLANETPLAFRIVERGYELAGWAPMSR